MKITDSQRRQILRGSFPHFPLEADEAKALEPCRIQITQRFWIDVKGAKKDRKTGWYVDYDVGDHRPRFMRRVGGYTHSVELAVAQEGEDAVPEEYQKELTMRARERHLQTVEAERSEELARRQFKSFADAARGVIVKQAAYGIDPGPTLARMLRELEGNLQDAKEAA